MIRKFSVILVGLLALYACSSIDCPVQHSVMSNYAVMTGVQVPDTLRDTMSVSTRRANGTDTILLNKAISLLNFSLNVSYSSPEDTLYFAFCNYPFAAVDTVWIKKENIPHFESVDCSASYFHNITAVRSTHYAIESLTINNSLVDYDPQKVHFHLYLKHHN